MDSFGLFLRYPGRCKSLRQQKCLEDRNRSRKREKHRRGTKKQQRRNKQKRKITFPSSLHAEQPAPRNKPHKSICVSEGILFTVSHNAENDADSRLAAAQRVMETIGEVTFSITQTQPPRTQQNKQDSFSAQSTLLPANASKSL